MEYVTTTSGERRRVHREYVDVYARFGRDGAIEPVCVMWKDGRSFRVDEVMETGGFGALVRGRQTARYRVRFEALADDLLGPRSGRKARLEAVMRRYASLLEAEMRAHPYDWFNFFDFWEQR